MFASAVSPSLSRGARSRSATWSSRIIMAIQRSQFFFFEAVFENQTLDGHRELRLCVKEREIVHPALYIYTTHPTHDHSYLTREPCVNAAGLDTKCMAISERAAHVKFAACAVTRDNR